MSKSPISIHAPQWGATQDLFDAFCRLSISIHAPQWGATRRRWLEHTAVLISIHAPQWGATNRLPPQLTAMQFQSTHPSGVRHVKKRVRICGWSISIHAPQWGATGRESNRGPPGKNFNPRTPVGCDPRPIRFVDRPIRISIHAPQWGATSAPSHAGSAPRFQSTHPSGVRLLDAAYRS